MFRGVSPTVQVSVALAVWPAASVAWTTNVWLPAGKPPYCIVVAVVHGPNGPPSSWQATLATASVVENENVAEVCVVGFAGSESEAMPTPIGTGSSAIADTVPVIVGPPGWSANGGYSGWLWLESRGEEATTYGPVGSTSSPVVLFRVTGSEYEAASRGASGFEISTIATSWLEDAAT